METVERWQSLAERDVIVATEDDVWTVTFTAAYSSPKSSTRITKRFRSKEDATRYVVILSSVPMHCAPTTRFEILNTFNGYLVDPHFCAVCGAHLRHQGEAIELAPYRGSHRWRQRHSGFVSSSAKAAGRACHVCWTQLDWKGASVPRRMELPGAAFSRS